MLKITTKTPKTLGWKVQRLRKVQKLTQEEFAEKLGISRVYMGYIEKGREDPSLKLLTKIARRFAIKIEDLFQR